MEIFNLDDVINPTTDIDEGIVDNIKADGITVRVGNRVMVMSVTDEVSLPEDDLKKEYEEKLAEAKSQTNEIIDRHKSDLNEAYRVKARELDKKIKEYEEKIRERITIPPVSREFADQGLSVAGDGRGRIYWYFNCVYAPKYVNNKRIDPKFAKRLMTPICIEIRANSDFKVENIRVVKIIGHQKFRHYHSLSNSSDCWGDFTYSGVDVSDQEKALDMAKKSLVVLETINEYSLGTRNPRGLSRFDTIKKHLLDDDAEVSESDNRTNTRNARSGIESTNVNQNLAGDVGVWSVD